MSRDVSNPESASRPARGESNAHRSAFCSVLVVEKQGMVAKHSHAKKLRTVHSAGATTSLFFQISTPQEHGGEEIGRSFKVFV